jgi:hypothetical protein
MRLSSTPGGGRTRASVLASVAGLAALLACADGATAPALRTAAGPPRTAALAATVPTSVAIEDALDRIFPALGDDADARGLRSAVEAVLDALSRRDNTATANAIERAEQLLNVYTRVGNGDAADLDAIALALASATP